MTPEEHLTRAELHVNNPRLYNLALATYHATMAVATMLGQMHICGHGNRGYCPYCAVLIHDGRSPE